MRANVLAWCFGITALVVAVIASFFRDRRSTQDQHSYVMFGRQTFDVVHRFEYGGFERSFALDLPTRSNSTTSLLSDLKYPILLVIHGKSSSPDDAKFFMGMTSNQTTALGFIVVYANASSIGGSPTWNAGVCCSPATTLDIDDVGYFERVLFKVAEYYNGDMGRVALTGYSNGGIMTQRLACAWAGHKFITVRAIAPVISSAGHKRSDGPGASECVAHNTYKRVSLFGLIDLPLPGLYEFAHSACPYEFFTTLPSEHYSCTSLHDTPALIVSGGLDKLVPLNGGWMKDYLSPPVHYLVRLLGDANGCDGIANTTTTFKRVLPTGETEMTNCTSIGGCRTNTTWCVGLSNGHNWQIIDRSNLESRRALLSPLLLWMLGPIAHSFDTSAHILSFLAQYCGNNVKAF
jgi:poly(3-hydroxybutyrate) depolymerase